MKQIYTITILIFNIFCCNVYAAEIPKISPPALFTGSAHDDSLKISIVLYLDESQEFILQEEMVMSDGNISSWQITGTWYQIRDGAFIQLTNANGYYRLINVGGKGNLYVPSRSPDGTQITIPIQTQSAWLPQYTLDGDFSITNHKNNIIYSAVLENIIVKYLARDTTTKSSTNAIEPLDCVLSDVVGFRWKITQLGKPYQGHIMPPGAYFFFLPEGVLDIFDGWTHTTGSYLLNNERLFLSATAGSTLFKELLEHTQYWKLTGEVLELWGEQHILALLEKM